MAKWCLSYNFHIITINLEDKLVKPKEEFFINFEELLKAYRDKKNALAYGCIPYNTDFKVYKVQMEEQDISLLDNFL